MHGKEWIWGYLEAEVSFGVYINLLEGKKQQYVVLKPYIMIQAKDRDVMEYIHSKFKFTTNITEKGKNKMNIMNAIRIQKMEDIDNVVKVLQGYQFISKEREKIYNRFVKAYERIKKIGYLWKSWDSKIGKFIDDCLPLQDNDSRQYDNDDWKKRIKNHLRSES